MENNSVARWKAPGSMLGNLGLLAYWTRSNMGDSGSLDSSGEL